MLSVVRPRVGAVVLCCCGRKWRYRATVYILYLTHFCQVTHSVSHVFYATSISFVPNHRSLGRSRASGILVQVTTDLRFFSFRAQ